MVIDPEGSELSHVLARVPPIDPCRVVEIGCGDGRLTRRFAASVASVLAFDPDEAAIAMFRAGGADPHVEIRCASVDRVDVPDRSADVVLFSWAL